MTTISIGDIERDWSGYLQRVRAGESLLITDHERPIAELRPVDLDDREVSSDRGAVVIDYLQTRIKDAAVPSRWRLEGVAEPTDACRQLSVGLTKQLFLNHGLLPVKVVVSRQNGIYLEYKSPVGRVLGIEVDNELDVVAAVSDADEVLASGAFEGDEAKALLRHFSSGLATAAGDP
jgi:antitoxin (DNA-binding transcriptional repressor) of toxin-antitoxin stability system